MNDDHAAFRRAIADTFGHPGEATIVGAGALPSAFAVTGLAVASIAAAGTAAARLVAAIRPDGSIPAVAVDRALASWWFIGSLAPEGWALPPVWDPVAGDYETADGWIRLHTNAPHHRAAALLVLGAAPDRSEVAAAVRGWRADALESAVIAAGGCAAAMRTPEDWASHPQGVAVAAEPLIERTRTPAGPPPTSNRATLDRPLAGVRVLDLTRVLAGPVATRFLAGLGADVLRLDPPEWEEPAVVPEVTLGKRRGRLDLRSPEGIDTFGRLLAGADIVVHGYRPGALERLGLGAAARLGIHPGLVDVSLDAYGFTGPWAGRRGFDSLVQMSSGIAEAGRRAAGRDVPVPLPAQALDHATGYLLAAAAIHGWTDRLADGRGTVARASLARTARLLTDGPAGSLDARVAVPDDASRAPELTGWGPARRLRPPVTISGTPLRWDVPAGPLGTERPPLSWMP